MTTYEGDVEVLLASSPLSSRGVTTKIKEIVEMPNNIEALMRENV